MPPEIRPGRTLDDLGDVFDELDDRLGSREPKAPDMLRAHLPNTASDEVDRAIGLLLAWGDLTRSDRGFVRPRAWAKYSLGAAPMVTSSRRVAEILAVLPDVRAAFARRRGGHVPEDPPIERFGAFLKKQGWSAFATWWALTAAEMASLSDARHTSAICTIAGALLEAALVAVATPAITANEWRQDFLRTKPPETWKLGELIAQAKSAGTLSPSQAAIASEVAELRNRIHPGRFSSSGAAPFSPPYSNQHEARQARDHLDRLLDAILKWPPMRPLT